MSSTNTTKSLAESLRDAMFPTEESLYKAHFSRNIWTIREFCALMGGISPERHHKILFDKSEIGTELDFKRISSANKIWEKFLDCWEDIYLTEKISRVDGEFYMTPWKFIKWVSMNDIPMKVKFFEALPQYLMEIYLEFQPSNAPLRNKPKYSRDYHEALYLRNARELISKSPRRLTYQEIYSHPYMQSILRQIRSLGHNYKKRTITESWLPKLEERKKGRPKKELPQNC